VEVQQTFYDPPPVATLEHWRAQAPDTFEFTIKAWQVITHFGSSRTYRRLRRPFGEDQKDQAGGFRLNDTVLAAWRETATAASDGDPLPMSSELSGNRRQHRGDAALLLEH
jgi:uncharacterized protein YecE (DUF72 family)